MITEIDLSQYYIKKQEIESAFDIEGDAATIIKNAIDAKPNLGTSHNDAARGDHNHDGTYLKSYTPPVASTTNAGIVQLNTSTNDSSVSQAATPSAVKAAYQLAETKTVTVNKLSTATTGYLATYEISQGGTLLGKIEIPKDFLIKSGTVKISQAANNPEQGYEKGDKYIDFLINVKEGSGVNSHIYVNLKDLIDVYTADGSSLQLINNEFSIKQNGVNGSHIANGVIENRHISSDASAKIPFSKLNITKQDIVGLEIPENDTNTLYYGDEQTIELVNENHFKVKDDKFANKSHSHGEITNEGILNGAGPNTPLITGTSGKIVAGAFGIGENLFSRGNHGHGDITYDGKLNADTTKGVLKVVVTDSQNSIKTINQIPSSNIVFPNAGLNSSGIVRLNNSITSNSQTEAATPYAVQQINDKFSNGTAKNAHTHTKSQITDLYNYKMYFTTSPINGNVVNDVSLNSTVILKIEITDMSNNEAYNLNTTVSINKSGFSYGGYVDSSGNTQMAFSPSTEQRKSISLTANNGNIFLGINITESGLHTIDCNGEVYQFFVNDNWKKINLGEATSTVTLYVNESIKLANLKIYRENVSFNTARHNYFLTSSNNFESGALDSNGDNIIKNSYKIIPEQYRAKYHVPIPMYNYGTIVGATNDKGIIAVQSINKNSSGNINGTVMWRF